MTRSSLQLCQGPVCRQPRALHCYVLRKHAWEVYRRLRRADALGDEGHLDPWLKEAGAPAPSRKHHTGLFLVEQMMKIFATRESNQHVHGGKRKTVGQRLAADLPWPLFSRVAHTPQRLWHQYGHTCAGSEPSMGIPVLRFVGPVFGGGVFLGLFKHSPPSLLTLSSSLFRH